LSPRASIAMVFVFPLAKVTTASPPSHGPKSNPRCQNRRLNAYQQLVDHNLCQAASFQYIQ
jgi:hypothetical protein